MFYGYSGKATQTEHRNFVGMSWYVSKKVGAVGDAGCHLWYVVRQEGW